MPIHEIYNNDNNNNNNNNNKANWCTEVEHLKFQDKPVDN